MEEELRLKEIQFKLKEQIDISENLNLNNIKIVAGIDVAYFKVNEREYGACSIVLFDYESKTILQEIEALEEVLVPYIPGCLAFREIPVILKALSKINSKIDLIITDGNGILHPNKMGLATHLSIVTGIPSIGIAKTYFSINNNEYVAPSSTKKGDYSEIVINNELLGFVFISKNDLKPIFISPGNKLSFKQCYDIVNYFIDNEYRIPIVTRIPNINTRILRKKYINEMERL